MKKAICLFGFAILLVAIRLSFQTDTVYARTDHCGTIGNETWTSSGNVHVITCDVTVASDSTLNIEEGAIVKVGSDYSLIVNGTIRVLGTTGNHVIITSLKDDTIGGDTNEDGAATSPNRGDWESIRFSDSSDDTNSLIEYAEIYYSGEVYYDNAGIRLNNASPTIRYSKVASSAGNAIGATLCSFPVLTGNTFKDNGINGLGLDGGTVCNGSVWEVTNTAYYLTGDVSVNANETLTVNPGVVVKFGGDYSIIVKGTLKVLGTSANKVYLTSGRDDVLKGDTNGDGGATSPTPGDWESVRFEDSSSDANSLIEYAVVRYGGEYYYDQANIRLNHASPTIRNTTISYSDVNAIGATLCSFPVLTGNTFKDNGINGLGLDGGTVCNGSVWKVTNTAYYLTGDVTVNANETLTVNPGVVVKFGGDYSIIVKGTLKVLGTNTRKVYFTSGRDDLVKGDTNGDGGSTSPAPGDWESIRFEDTSNDANSLIKYAVIRYGGEYYYDNAAIKLNSASPTIRFTTINSNRTGLSANNSKPKTRCNDIRSNDEFGIKNETTGVIVKAENNWWGAPSGPYHAGTNPSGAGNAVTDGVDFKPWLVKPFNDPCLDLIFADGFESGTFTNWSSKVVDGGDLSVTTVAKLVGQYGMKANIDDNTAIFVTDDNPVTEKEYRARFYFDPNAITMADGDTHIIFLGYSGTTVKNFRIEFRRSAGEFQLQIGALKDSGAWGDSGWTKLSNYGDTTAHIIEVNWNAASGAGANDGSMKLWIDEVEEKTLSNLDNDTRKVDRVRIGAVEGIDVGTRGVYYFDAFESRRTSYIGPVSSEELEEEILLSEDN